MTAAIGRAIEKMDDEEKATVAAQILGEVNPTKDNLSTFFDQLKTESETVHAELISRAGEQE
jgi:hypothetical protein